MIPFPRFAPSGKGRALGALPAPLLLATALILGLASCTFERTAEVETDGVPPGGEVPQSSPPVPPDLADSARQTVLLFREAVATGDLSLALTLLDRDATLVDALAGKASEAATRGELLLELRQRHAAGIQFEPLETEVVFPVEGSALIMTRLAMLQEGADGIGDEIGRVYETVLLVSSPEGWRIRHLHRSLVPPPA